MRVKTKLLLIAALFVLALPMVLPAGSVWANDSVKTVQGVVTDVDSCSGAIFIDNVPFQAKTLDLSGLLGARVQATYADAGKGKVIKSIQVIRGGANQ